VITSDDKWHSHVSAWFIDVVNNRIVVELADYSYENMAIFRDGVLDSPLVTFAPCIGRLYIEHVEGTVEYPVWPEETGFAPFSTLFPGSGIEFWRPAQPGISGGNLGSGSIGYLGNSQGRAGFVTAAHIGGRRSEGDGLRVGDWVLNRSTGNIIGTVRSLALHNLDAAFVELDNVNTVSRNLPSGGGQTATYAWIGVGAIVTSIGHVSGLRTGRVETTSTNVSITSQGERGSFTFQVTNAMRASNMNSARGDSGGIVYSAEGTWSQPRNPIVGIVVSGTSNITTISNALNINNMNSGLRVNLR
ncbi:MAG: S1 family peptidase, partial [Defluviitaleaceae bacterium]|nr:S1 family peptidase [Defluviitaleaceae bacterium]